MAPKKIRPLTRKDVIPMRDVAEQRVVILIYSPATDTIAIDAEGLSRLEIRGILYDASALVSEEA